MESKAADALLHPLAGAGVGEGSRGEGPVERGVEDGNLRHDITEPARCRLHERQGGGIVRGSVLGDTFDRRTDRGGDDHALAKRGTAVHHAVTDRIDRPGSAPRQEPVQHRVE